MSRSVNYQSGADLVKYVHVEPVYGEYNPDAGEYAGEEYNDFESQQIFEDTCENIKSALQEVFPSFESIPCRSKQMLSSDARAWRYADQECWPLMRNGHCIVYLAEYCGLISISFCPADECDENWPRNFAGIQSHWIKAAEKKIDAAIESIADRLICCGRFSNGEAFFSRVPPEAELAAIIKGGGDIK